MKNLKSKGRKLLSFTLAMATALTLMPFGGETASAATLSNQGVSVTTGQDAMTLAQSLVGDGITIESAKKICADDLQVGTVNNGESLFGVSGLMLSTGDAAGTIENNDYHSFSQIDQDQDLAALIGQEGKTYGGDTAGLEFTMTANGTLLNFNYVFASREFDQGTNFNDIFGLFVSVNGGAYENIALIPEGNPAYAGKYVTIDNIREGNTISSNDTGEHTYFTADGPKASGSIYNGVSHIFTAQKEVNKGDTVSVKFVIADVGDTGFSSSVIIQAGSLSFDASGAKLDCVDEAIKKLDAGTYEITSDGNVYVFHVGNTKSIPIQGTDANGKPYDFIGKTVSIVKCIDETQKSDATEIEIPERAATPEVVSKTEVSANDKSITVVKPVPSQEYILVPAGTNVTDEVWGNAQKSDGSSIIFTKDSLGNTLTGTEEYVLYTRVYATKESLKSESSGASCEFTLHEHTASEWIVDKPASTTEEGSMHRECTSCKEVLETKVIPKYTGSVAYEPEISEGAPATDVVVDEDALKNKVLTDAEKTIVKNGGNADIKLAVTAIETTVSDSEKEKVNAILGDNQKTGMYIDISLLLKVVDNNGNVIKEKEKIHEPGETFTIQLTVPDDLISNDADTTRTYQIARVHNGVAEILDTEWDASTQTITFETDKFSTYAILYTDSDTNNNNSNNNNGNNNNNNSNNNSTNNNNSNKNNSTNNNNSNKNNSTNNNNSNKNNSTSTNNSNKNNGTTLTVSTNAVTETDAAVSENAISTVTSAPQTGDDAQTGMWLALILAGVFLLGIAKKRAW